MAKHRGGATSLKREVAGKILPVPTKSGRGKTLKEASYMNQPCRHLRLLFVMFLVLMGSSTFSQAQTETVLVANFMNGNNGVFNSRVYLWNPSESAGDVTVRVFNLPLTGDTAQELTTTPLSLGTLGAKSGLNVKLAEDILSPLGTSLPHTEDGGNLTLEFTIRAPGARGTAQVFSSGFAFGTYPLQLVPAISAGSPTVLVANFMNGNNEAFNARVYLFNPSASAGEVTVRVFTLPLSGGTAQELTTTPLALGTLGAKSALNIKLAENILTPLGIALPYTTDGGNLTVELTIQAADVQGAAQVFSSDFAFGTYPLQTIPSNSAGSPTVLVVNFTNGNNVAFNSRVYLFNPSQSSGEVTVRAFTLPLSGGLAQELTAAPLSLGTLGARSALNIKLAEDILTPMGVTLPYTTDGGNLALEFTIQAADVRGASQVFSSDIAFGTLPLQMILPALAGSPTVLLASFMNGNDAALDSRVYLFNPSQSAGDVAVRVFSLPSTGGLAQELTVTPLNLGTLGARSALTLNLVENILTPLGIQTPYTDDGGNLTLEFTIQAANVRGAAQVFASSFAFGTYPQAIQSPPIISEVQSSVLSKTGDQYVTSSLVRIDVTEISGEDDLADGTIRITSASQEYDSGEQPLTLGSILYHWDTTGLNPADDYVIEVTLTDAAGQTTTDNSLVITLAPNPPAINKLVSELDISVPAQGLEFQIVRTYLLDSGFDGPLGFGWTHTYLRQVVETADGLVKVFNPDGSGSFFKPNAGGGYDPPKGDFRTLTKNAEGTFELREKFGTLFLFDAAGKLTSIQDRNGNTVTLSYDGSGRLQTITDASGQVSIFDYDSNSRLTSITDPAGRSVSYEYDGSGNLISAIPIGGLKTTYEYDSAHNLTVITDPAGRRTFFTTTADDRLESTFDEGETNKLAFEYGVPNPNQMRTTDAIGNQTILTFDNNSLVTEITDPLGNTEIFSYDGEFNLIGITDRNGGTSTRTYDVQGNLLTTTDALGDTVTMTYEPVFNQMTSLTGSKGNTTTFRYDTNGNQTAVRYPDGSTEIFTYDTSGNLASKTDRMNQTINLTYDFRGMFTAKLFQDGSSDLFTYDGAGNLLSATDATGSIGFVYDSLDRLIQVSYPGGEVVSYAFDASNNRTQITYPDGTVFDHEYDEVNRLTEISESAQMVASYTYDQLSRIARRDLGNGNFGTFNYDQSSRLLELINSKSTSEIISSFSYTYDINGNRLTMITLEGTTQYTYDANNQLTQVVLPDGSTIAYNFDPAGNRNSVTVDGSTTSYTTNNLNQYTDVGGDTYTYDPNGNVTSKTTAQGVTTFVYDFENRLIRVGTPTETVTYTYDPFGRRTSKTTSFGTTNFVYDDKRIIMETDDAGTVQATYIYGIGVDEVLVMNRGGVDYYYMQDGLGSVTDLSDFSENVIESFSYDAYGTPSNQSSVGNPYLYTGREFEPETGTYFYRARYYDPEIGRFITTDPIGFAGGTNLYTYVSNNPINLVDPSGLQGLGAPGPNNCTLLNFQCETFFCNPLYILVQGGTDCIFCRLEVRKKCGGTQRGDPTFIQACQGQVKKRSHTDIFSEYDGLRAKISVPYEGSLVRGNIPIFGLAYGEVFQEYHVEYGEGEEPTEWITIATSAAPQTKDFTPADLDDSLDTTIHGNLATWDTGLKSYVYLPSHPKDHPIDLNGTYTVRLVVTGNDGRTVEDRVTVDVANVIPNAWGGKATSKDGRVTLSVPEQAIMDSFRLILIQPVEDTPVALPSGRQLIGNMYAFREPGEKFTKEALLKMVFSEEEIVDMTPDRLGIYAYDPQTIAWDYLDSMREKDGDSVFVKVRELYSYYALMASDLPDEGSRLVPAITHRRQIQEAPTIKSDGHFLVKNTFEDGLGEWANRDSEVGAEVTLDDTSTFDRTLKITNSTGGGNFAVNVVTTPFDAQDYPLVQFDYRISQDVKTNFLVKVEGRWYEIGFTDDPKELHDKRVNIAHIGDITTVVADDQWHTAQFNLYDMLRTKTGNTLVEQMIMADWDVGGYMKLQFGKNAKGATYYIDHFTISQEASAGLRMDGDTILVDNFNQKEEINALGGATTVFADALEKDTQEEKRLKARFTRKGALGEGHALVLTYNLPRTDAYAVYLTDLQNLDLRGYQALTFFLKGARDKQDLLVGLKDGLGHEQKVPVSRYLRKKVAARWQQVTIPLVAFSEDLDWSGMDSLSFSFEHTLDAAGTVLVEDVEFHKNLDLLMVEDFEHASETNLLGRKHWTFSSGAADITGEHARASSNGLYGLSYGGDIGAINATAKEPKSYAGWATELGGVDCSRCSTLSFRIKGTQGGENFSVYLDDGNFRWGIEVAKYAWVTTSWQRVTIPLHEFADYGVDLTHLEEFQVVFEGTEMSGTIFLDDIQLGLPTDETSMSLAQRD